MHTEVLSSFVKHAVSMNTLRSYLGARAAQGVGGASALGKSLAGSGAQTSRQAVQGMSGLQKHRLGGVVQGGKDVRQMQRLPEQVGLGQTAKDTRARVENAIKQERANPGSSRAGGVQLSRAYEGYMDASGKSYNPAHMEQVMGLASGSVKPLKGGPTALSKSLSRPKAKPQPHRGTSSATANMDEVTAPSTPNALASSGMRPSARPPARPTARPPGRPPVRGRAANEVDPYAPTPPPMQVPSDILPMTTG